MWSKLSFFIEIVCFKVCLRTKLKILSEVHIYREYDAIVKLYTNLLSQTRNFEYEQWLENSNLTIALLVEDAMTTLNALYRILENSNLHIRIFRAVERIARAMTTSKVEYH